MDECINDEIRPAIGVDDVEQLVDRMVRNGCTFKTTVTFAGWVQKVDVDTPAVANDFRVLHHMERYWFAADFLKPLGLKNLSVIDVGLGEAHGVLQFLKHLPSTMIGKTVGVEIDKEIADRMQVQYPFIELINANIEELSTPDVFDVVFCYELMGNKSLSSDDILLQQLDNLCAPNGHIFLSIAGFGNTEAGRTRTKDYSARIYDTPGFISILKRMLPGYHIRFFGQIYPLKRMFQSQIGVWENPGLEKDTDFLICVARKNNKISGKEGEARHES